MGGVGNTCDNAFAEKVVGLYKTEVIRRQCPWRNLDAVEFVKRSMEWLIRRIIKAASRISYSGRRWWLHVASSFPLAHHYRAVLGTG